MNEKSSSNRNKVETGLNIASAVTSAASTVYPPLLGISLFLDVFKEIRGFCNNKDFEKRTNEFQYALDNVNIQIEDFKNRIETLEEHDQYVMRNNVRYYYMDALPEVTDSLIDSMISFIMEENHRDMNEEICEILRDCNSTDIEFLRLVRIHKEENAFRGEFNKALKKAQDEGKTISQNTIYWRDFLMQLGIEDDVSANDIISGEETTQEGSKYYETAYLIRSLFKMQRLGIIDIRSYTTLGTSSQYFIESFQLTLFADELLKHIMPKRSLSN